MDQETLSEVKERQGKLLAAQSSIQNMDIGGYGSLLFLARTLILTGRL
jgi:hypothetical protein